MPYEGNHRYNHTNRHGNRYGVPHASGFLGTHRGLSQWATRKAHDLDDLRFGSDDQSQSMAGVDANTNRRFDNRHMDIPHP